VADLAGVSTAVVSYVVNAGPRPVSNTTRERVLAAIEALDYHPNAVARALRLQRTKTVGLLVPDIGVPFYGEFARAILDTASETGYSVLILDAHHEPALELQPVQAQVASQVDGVLAIGEVSETDLTVFQTAGTPFVTLGRPDDDPTMPTVAIDEYRAARAGVDHLMDHGHRGIALLGGPEAETVATRRRQAWLDATGFGPRQAALHSVAAAFSRRGGYEGCRALLSRGARFDALFVASDIQAMGALRALAEAGLRTPQDLAVVSFDGTEESAYSHPPLTVIRQPIALMATLAFDLLLRKESREAGIHRIVPHELVLRESCGHSSADRSGP
jgi:LacI family transcriptional regulator